MVGPDAGFAAREMCRTRGSGGSPRNGGMTGRARVRDGSGNGQRFVSVLPPLTPLKGGRPTSAVAGDGRTLQRTARRRGA